ncbi:U11/U12 small nuclear ribonucleoprotein 59 kDa protein [Zea mays]|nr:U11/U12 small nuclear ribonucleoprotein 59 kDa protein [Zea mays]
MQQIARKKTNVERKRLESELELALMVEKLQELRSIRVQKMKKQDPYLNTDASTMSPFEHGEVSVLDNGG